MTVEGVLSNSKQGGAENSEVKKVAFGAAISEQTSQAQKNAPLAVSTVRAKVPDPTPVEIEKTIRIQYNKWLKDNLGEAKSIEDIEAKLIEIYNESTKSSAPEIKAQTLKLLTDKIPVIIGVINGLKFPDRIKKRPSLFNINIHNSQLETKFGAQLKNLISTSGDVKTVFDMPTSNKPYSLYSDKEALAYMIHQGKFNPNHYLHEYDVIHEKVYAKPELLVEYVAQVYKGPLDCNDYEEKKMFEVIASNKKSLEIYLKRNIGIPLESADMYDDKILSQLEDAPKKILRFIELNEIAKDPKLTDEDKYTELQRRFGGKGERLSDNNIQNPYNLKDYKRLNLNVPYENIYLKHSISEMGGIDDYLKGLDSELVKDKTFESTTKREQIKDFIREYIAIKVIPELYKDKINETIDADGVRHVSMKGTVSAVEVNAAYDKTVSMFANMSTDELLAYSDRWHNINGIISDELKYLNHLEWKPVLTQDHVINGITITELTTSTQLSVEGNILKHCVGTGGYASDCAQQGDKTGRTHILSLRDKDGNPTSTVEIRFIPKQEKYNHSEHNDHIPNTAKTYAIQNSDMNLVVVQHMAVKDSEPTAQDKVALQTLVDDIASGKTPLVVNSIKMINEKLGKIDSNFNAKPVYDKTVPVAAQYTIEDTSFFIPTPEHMDKIDAEIEGKWRIPNPLGKKQTRYFVQRKSDGVWLEGIATGKKTTGKQPTNIYNWYDKTDPAKPVLVKDFVPSNETIANTKTVFEAPMKVFGKGDGLSVEVKTAGGYVNINSNKLKTEIDGNQQPIRKVMVYPENNTPHKYDPTFTPKVAADTPIKPTATPTTELESGSKPVVTQIGETPSAPRVNVDEDPVRPRNYVEKLPLQTAQRPLYELPKFSQRPAYEGSTALPLVDRTPQTAKIVPLKPIVPAPVAEDGSRTTTKIIPLNPNSAQQPPFVMPSGENITPLHIRGEAALKSAMRPVTTTTEKRVGKDEKIVAVSTVGSKTFSLNGENLSAIIQKECPVGVTIEDVINANRGNPNAPAAIKNLVSAPIEKIETVTTPVLNKRGHPTREMETNIVVHFKDGGPPATLNINRPLTSGKLFLPVAHKTMADVTTKIVVETSQKTELKLPNNEAGLGKTQNAQTAAIEQLFAKKGSAVDVHITDDGFVHIVLKDKNSVQKAVTILKDNKIDDKNIRVETVENNGKLIVTTQAAVQEMAAEETARTNYAKLQQNAQEAAEKLKATYSTEQAAAEKRWQQQYDAYVEAKNAQPAPAKPDDIKPKIEVIDDKPKFVVPQIQQDALRNQVRDENLNLRTQTTQADAAPQEIPAKAQADDAAQKELSAKAQANGVKGKMLALDSKLTSGLIYAAAVDHLAGWLNAKMKGDQARADFHLIQAGSILGHNFVGMFATKVLTQSAPGPIGLYAKTSMRLTQAVSAFDDAVNGKESWTRAATNIIVAASDIYATVQTQSGMAGELATFMEIQALKILGVAEKDLPPYGIPTQLLLTVGAGESECMKLIMSIAKNPDEVVQNVKKIASDITK